MVLNLLASFHFESLAFHIVIFCSVSEESVSILLLFSYIFQVLAFQSHINFYSRLNDLSRDVDKNPGF